MLRLRLILKRRELVRREDVDALIDEICGVVLTHLSGMGARCSRDLVEHEDELPAIFREPRNWTLAGHTNSALGPAFPTRTRSTQKTALPPGGSGYVR